MGDHQGSNPHLGGTVSSLCATCLEESLNPCSCDEHYVCSVDCMAWVMTSTAVWGCPQPSWHTGGINGGLSGLAGPWVALTGQSGS